MVQVQVQVQVQPQLQLQRQVQVPVLVRTQAQGQGQASQWRPLPGKRRSGSVSGSAYLESARAAHAALLEAELGKEPEAAPSVGAIVVPIGAANTQRTPAKAGEPW